MSHNLNSLAKKITIITPCFNEELNVKECASALRIMMARELPNYRYEHIFSDNSSTDKTVSILRELAAADANIKVLMNSRNVGPFRNMWSAMKFATGDAIIPLLPADLQDPPDIIPKFVKSWESGDLIVYGIRAKRNEGFLLRFVRFSYYKLISKFASSVIPLNSGEFLLADKRVIDSIIGIDDEYPYIRGRIAQTGVRSSSISYTWTKRKNGKSNNSYLNLIDQAINGFVSTSRIPARLALLVGFFFSFLGIIGAVLMLISFIINRHGTSTGIPTIIVSIFLFGGLQLFFAGIIGEYVLSIHGQVRKSPPMFIIEQINI
jgi:glycosyltransferase involved in cell wall biosynthesis